MSEKIESMYEQLYNDILEAIPVLDPDVAIRVMQISRSLEKISPTRSKPHVNLNVKYKDGVNLGQKVDEIRDKYPIQAAVNKWDDGIIISGLMNIKNVQTVCSDPDMVEIKGSVNARHN